MKQEKWIIVCKIDIGQKGRVFPTSQDAYIWLMSSDGDTKGETVSIEQLKE